MRQVDNPEASKELQPPLPVRNDLNFHLDAELPSQIAPTAHNYSHLGDSHLLAPDLFNTREEWKADRKVTTGKHRIQLKIVSSSRIQQLWFYKVMLNNVFYKIKSH